MNKLTNKQEIKLLDKVQDFVITAVVFSDINNVYDHIKIIDYVMSEPFKNEFYHCVNVEYCKYDTVEKLFRCVLGRMINDTIRYGKIEYDKKEGE